MYSESSVSEKDAASLLGDGWTVDESTITDPDGDVAVQLTDTSAEKGQGLAEWLMITAFVVLLVVVVIEMGENGRW